MDSLGKDIQFRSVPLIQRGGMTGLGNAMPSRPSTNHAQEPDGSHAPAASRGGERRSRQARWARPSRLSLVTDEQLEYQQVTDDLAEEHDPWREDPAYGRRGRGSRRPSRRRSVDAHDFTDGSSCTRGPQDGETAWEARAAIFTEDDLYAVRGVPGSRRRREAVSSGMRNVSAGMGSVLEAVTAHLRGTLLLCVVVLVVFMLYAPARNLYVANRRLDALQATYDALLEENDSIRGELELLQTREGIENEARARGFVDTGETKVVVEGLPEQTGHQGSAATVIADVEVEDASPWYVHVLDALFGYEPEP